MSQNNIEFKVIVNENAAVSGLDKIDNSVDNLTDSLESLEKVTTSSLGDVSDAVTEVGDDYDELADKSQKAAKSQEEVAESSKGANKGLKLVSGGAKLVGNAFKAMGIGAIIAVFATLWEALQRNQKAMDIIATVTNTVSIVFNKVVSAISEAVDKVKEGTGGFDGMKEVVVNLMKIALTPLKLSFLAIKASVLAAQLIWEQSFFGKKNPEEVERLKAALSETKNEIVQIGKDTIDAGKAVATNLGDAIGEVTQVVKGSIDGIKQISVQASIEQGKTVTDASKNFERLQILQERTALKLQTQIELQRQIRDDDTKTFAQRISANKEISKLLNQQSLDEKKLAQQRLDAAVQQAALNKGNIELQNEVLSLENELLEIDERITGQRSEQLSNRNALEKEAQEERMAAEEEERLLKLEAEQLATEERVEREMEAQELILEFTRFTEEEKLAIELENNLKRIEDSALTDEEKYQASLVAYKDFDNALMKKEKATADEQKKLNDEVAANRKANLQDGLAIFSSVSSIMSNLTQARQDAEMKKFEENQATQLTILEARHAEELAGFTGTEEEKQVLIETQAAEKDQMERDYMTEKSQMEHDAAVTNKAIKLVDATIEGGLAILASVAQLGPIFGPIVGGALVATNLGIIAAQSVPPAVVYRKGGVLNGPSHEEGGILTPYGELEGGEGVINNVSMSNPNLRNMASAANEAGGGTAFGNGKPIHVIMDNVNQINDKKVYLNTNELNDSIDAVELVDKESYI